MVGKTTGRYTFRALNIKPRWPSSPPDLGLHWVQHSANLTFPTGARHILLAFWLLYIWGAARWGGSLRQYTSPLHFSDPEFYCFLCYFPLPLFLVSLLKFKDPSWWPWRNTVCVVGLPDGMQDLEKVGSSSLLCLLQLYSALFVLGLE